MNNQIIKAYETSDGAGVKIYRSIGQTQNIRLDPFLMLDEFCSDNPDDYIDGFPAHPHRGFETFTYMIEGHLKHEDSMGNSGELKSGELQWMTAGRGIIHSEMPLQKNGLMKGFQLWVNLPAEEKMKAPQYRDISQNEIIQIEDDWAKIKLIAGNFKGHSGPINGLSTELEYMDISLTKGSFDFDGASHKNYFLYVFDGQIQIDQETVSTRSGMSFTGQQLMRANQEARFLLIGGKPIREPICQYGPFVMNTKAEIMQTIDDYNSGKFGSIAKTQ